MRIPRIFTYQSLAENQRVRLEENPSQHLSKVLRLQEGAQLIVFNGKGGQFEAAIDTIEKKHITITIGKFNPIDRESPLNIHLGIALSKGDRMEFIVQKATELGVNVISPVFSSRSEVKLKGDRAEKKLQHWQQIVISACEQCGRNIPPTIHPVQTLDHWLSHSSADLKFVLHHRTEQSLDTRAKVENVDLLIGPEGGLSDIEIQSALHSSFVPLAIGPRVLRTETAPLAAITLLQYIWGDI
ncbi:MAG: 16S rRNA (uracil1498-N3)-methyltransferase [Gammaproteobacteria bacterium]|jgi:16S rRNA (uracil1498-N3)-methyltransferase